MNFTAYNFEKNFKKQKFTKAIINSKIFRKVLFKECTFKDIDFEKVEFWKTTFVKTTFINCNFHESLFCELSFQQSKFIGCKFKKNGFSHFFFNKKLFLNCKFLNDNFNSIEYNSKCGLKKEYFIRFKNDLISTEKRNILQNNLSDVGFNFLKNSKFEYSSSPLLYKQTKEITNINKYLKKTNYSFSDKKKKTNKYYNELIEGKGFIILKNKIQTKLINQAFKIIMKKEKNEKKFSTDKRNKQFYINNLFGLDPIFQKILPKKKVFDEISKILGKNFYFGFYGANVLFPGAKGQPFHLDYPYPMFDKEDGKLSLFNYKNPMNLQIQIMLTDINENNGPTGLVEHSQKLQLDPKKLQTYEFRDNKSHDLLFKYKKKQNKFKIKNLIGKKGSVIIFNGLSWHRAGNNFSKDQMRITLNIQLLPNYVKPQHKFLKIKKTNSNLIKRLAGKEFVHPIDV